MYAFLFSLYYALFTGQWESYTYSQLRTILTNCKNDAVNLLVNALGGNFSELQTLSTTLSIGDMTCVILALVTFIGLCLAVWKVMKSILSIFFQGWR